MPTNTRTVIFTDLADYTAEVSRSDREGLRRILSEHEALVGPLVQRYRGRVVKNLGDSFMCLFPAATDALRAAMDIQAAVAEQAAIQVKIGVATGDVEEIDGDAFGESVNLAARILSQTPQGQIWFGPATRVCMNAAEIPWESVGRFSFKGIPGEQEVYRAVPTDRAWLPEELLAAVKRGTLVRFVRGSPPPRSLPSEPLVLLEGFEPGSAELEEAVGLLPVLDPASLLLAAYNIAPSDRHAWLENGRGLVIGTPEALERAIQQAERVITRGGGTDTIVLEMGSGPDLELMICGLALPAVPLSNVVASYAYDLLPDGRWVNRSDRAVLRVEVTPGSTRLQALIPGIQVGGRAIASGEQVELQPGLPIKTPQRSLEYRPGAAGYVGMLLSETEMTLGVSFGQTAEIGREPNHPGLAFPDRRGQDNIRWCSGPRAAKAKEGGFTLDRALAGRRQASIQPLGDSFQVTPLHDRCPTYLLRHQTGELERAMGPVIASSGDMVIAATTVVALRAPT